MTPSRSHLAIVVVLALVVRMGFLLWGFVGWRVLPPNTLTITYLEQGRELAEGKGYLRHVGQTLTCHEMLHPPGFPLLLAGADKVFGNPDIAVQVLGMIEDTLAAVLLYWLTASLLGAQVGLAAGCIYALYLPIAYVSTIGLIPEGFQALFVLSTLVCFLEGAKSPSTRQALYWFMAGGILNGLNAYLRPDYMLLPVVLAVGLWAATRRFRRAVCGAGLALIVTLLVLLPWAYRNHKLCNRWVFTSSSVGATLVTGLGEFHNVWGFGSTDFDRATEAKAVGIASPWLPEADFYFRGVFWRAVEEHPGAYLLSVMKRIPLAMAAPQTFGYENPTKTQTFTMAREKGLDRFGAIKARPFYIFEAYWDYIIMAAINLAAVLCSLFMFIMGKGKRGIIFLLLCPHLYAIAAHILTHFEPRFILPSTWSFLIGLAYVITGGWRTKPEINRLESF